MRSSTGILPLLAALWAGAIVPLPASAQTETERELAELRAAIGRLERDLTRQIDRRDDGVAELRAIEISLAETRTRLAALARDIEAQAERRDSIDAELAAANRALNGEQGALAEQVRMSYMTGRQEFAKLLLSQDDPADFGRMLVYYDYLNRHRGDRIAAVTTEMARLAELSRQSAEAARALAELDAAEQAALRKLESERAERAALVAGLNSEIESSGSQIERMRAEEANLNEIIARLAEALEGYPVTTEVPFSEQRGKLRWPVEGRLASGYGSSGGDSGFRQSGVVIEADEGTPVRSIYPGRVIHSQWSPLMGLLIIVDHGENYWSLYGHNAALHREFGDWVTGGEIIAEVGDTGGQLGTGLFFSIRRQGEPVDPGPWFQ